VFSRWLQIEPVSSVHQVAVPIRFDAHRCIYICKYTFGSDPAH